MYKVLIIDDDSIIRKGLKNIIDWQQYGFVIMGEAKNGEEGLSLTEEINPDLILTDIRMPNINGLEMIKSLRESHNMCKIIIITAYKNFEYAKTALQYGVSDLILKPTKLHELTHAIAKAKEEIDEHFQQEEEYRIKEKLFQENLPILKERFLHDLTFGLEGITEAENDRLELFNINLKQYFIIICRFNETESQSKYDIYLHQFGISRLCSDIFDKHFSVQRIQLRLYQSVFILSPIHSERPDTKVKQLLRDLSERFISITQRTIQKEIAIGISGYANGIESLNRAYKEAELALEKIFFTGSQIVLEYEDGDACIDCSETIDLKLDGFIPSIRSGNSLKVQTMLDQLLQDMKHKQIDSNICRKKFGELFWKIFMSLDNGDHKSTEYLNIIKAIFGNNDIDSIVEKLNSYIFSFVDKNHKNQNKAITNVTEKAKAIIESNYNSSISLTKVADQVFVSPSYLSRLFKKTEGLTFNEYVNSIRIKKAIELFETTKLKSYEIAEKVGISDPHYFSKTFKRITGISPSKYRTQN